MHLHLAPSLIYLFIFPLNSNTLNPYSNHNLSLFPLPFILPVLSLPLLLFSCLLLILYRNLTNLNLNLLLFRYYYNLNKESHSQNLIFALNIKKNDINIIYFFVKFSYDYI